MFSQKGRNPWMALAGYYFISCCLVSPAMGQTRKIQSRVQAQARVATTARMATTKAINVPGSVFVPPTIGSTSSGLSLVPSTNTVIPTSMPYSPVAGGIVTPSFVQTSVPAANQTKLPSSGMPTLAAVGIFGGLALAAIGVFMKMNNSGKDDSGGRQYSRQSSPSYTDPAPAESTTPENSQFDEKKAEVAPPAAPVQEPAAPATAVADKAATAPAAADVPGTMTGTANLSAGFLTAPPAEPVLSAQTDKPAAPSAPATVSAGATHRQISSDDSADLEKSRKARSQSKTQERSAILTTGPKTCTTNAYGLLGSDQLKANLSGLMQGREIVSSGIYRWNLGNGQKFQLRMVRGKIEIFVNQVNDWKAISQLCSNGETTTIDLDVYGPARVTVIHRDGKFYSSTTHNGSSLDRDVVVGSLETEGNVPMAKASVATAKGDSASGRND